MVLMFQRKSRREFAPAHRRRILGASIFTAPTEDIDLHFTVAAGSFHPRPKVDAEVLRFMPRAISPFAI